MAVHLFENKGWENTYKTAELAREYAKEHGLKYVVLASKTGYTIDIFMETFAKAGVDVKFVSAVIVTLSPTFNLTDVSDKSNSVIGGFVTTTVQVAFLPFFVIVR